jgi:nitrous oxide reductase accessory protein NosL
MTDFVNYPIRGDKPTHMGARSQAEAAGEVRVWTMGGQDGHFPQEVIGDERFAADHGIKVIGFYHLSAQILWTSQKRLHHPHHRDYHKASKEPLGFYVHNAHKPRRGRR